MTRGFITQVIRNSTPTTERLVKFARKMYTQEGRCEIQRISSPSAERWEYFEKRACLYGAAFVEARRKLAAVRG